MWTPFQKHKRFLMQQVNIKFSHEPCTITFWHPKKSQGPVSVPHTGTCEPKT